MRDIVRVFKCRNCGDIKGIADLVAVEVKELNDGR